MADYKSGYGNRPLWQWLLLYLVIGGVIYGAIYYFVRGRNGGYTYNQPAPQSNNATQRGVGGSGSNTAPEQVTVSGSEFAFNPSTIKGKVGQPMTINFKNTGTFAHNLTISDLNVSTQTIQPGAQDTITFTPNKAGSFSFICTVPGHADRGMKGTLVVQ